MSHIERIEQRHGERPGEDGWIPWSGGECPVAPETKVDTRWRDGCVVFSREAGEREWGEDGGGTIIAYRISVPHPSEPDRLRERVKALEDGLRDMAEFQSGHDSTLGALHRLATIRAMARALLNQDTPE